MKRWMAVGVVAGLCCAGPGAARAQEGGEGMPPMPKPTQEHERLTKDVGVWDASVKQWMAPGQPPMESTGVETITSLGGFWQVSRFDSEMGGQRFEGLGLVGWDPMHKEYVTSWVDSLSPAISHGKGSYDEATRTFSGTFEGIGPDGKPSKLRQVMKWSDDDTRFFSLHALAPDGQEVKVMEIAYKRRK